MITGFDYFEIVTSEAAVDGEENARVLFVHERISLYGLGLGDKRVDEQIVVDDELRAHLDLGLAFDLLLKITQPSS